MRIARPSRGPVIWKLVPRHVVLKQSTDHAKAEPLSSTPSSQPNFTAQRKLAEMFNESFDIHTSSAGK